MPVFAAAGLCADEAAAKPKLGPLLPVIDAILEADRTAPAKQRHTAKRIFERLRDEHGFAGGYTVVKDYVRLQRARGRARSSCRWRIRPAMRRSISASAVGVIGGVRMKIHFFCMDLPQSDACFVKAYPAETTEAFLDGHVSAFAFFGGVPLSILYDNLKIAVAKICGDGKRERTRAFTELVSHYLFKDRFGRPGKGNDKGKVEGLVKYARANFMTPIPEAASFDALNADAGRALPRPPGRARRPPRGDDRRAAGRRSGGVARFADDAAGALREARRPGVVDRAGALSLQRLLGADGYGFQDVLVKGFVDEVVILCGGEEIARHPRFYGRAQFVFDPAALSGADRDKSRTRSTRRRRCRAGTLPEAFQHLRHLLEARMGNRGKREFIQVLRLMEAFPKRSSPPRRPTRSGSARSASTRSSRSRCRQSRAPTGPARSVRLSPSADDDGQDDIGRRLRGARFRGSGMTRCPPRPIPAPPQVLLAHHLQAAQAADVPARVRQGRRANARARASIIPAICCAWSSSN